MSDSGELYECPHCDYETLIFDESVFEPDDGNLFHSSDAQRCPSCPNTDESWARPPVLQPKEDEDV